MNRLSPVLVRAVVVLGLVVVLAAIQRGISPTDAGDEARGPLTAMQIEERLAPVEQAFDEATTAAGECLAAARYVFDRASMTVTLPNGGALELPADGGADNTAISLSSAYQDWVRVGDRCNESAGLNDILQDAGVVAPPPPFNARVAFFNDLELRQYPCLIDHGWELGEIIVNRFGQVEYEWRPRQDHEDWDEWGADITECRVKLFGWMSPPEELIPPIEEQD